MPVGAFESLARDGLLCLYGLDALIIPRLPVGLKEARACDILKPIEAGNGY